MQTSVPELMDIRQEPAEVHEMYGTRPGKTSFANNCLLARRLVERGVRSPLIRGRIAASLVSIGGVG